MLSEASFVAISTATWLRTAFCEPFASQVFGTRAAQNFFKLFHAIFMRPTSFTLVALFPSFELTVYIAFATAVLLEVSTPSRHCGANLLRLFAKPRKIVYLLWSELITNETLDQVFFQI